MVDRNFGIRLLQGVAYEWVKDCDPVQGLRLADLISRLRERLHDRNYFQELVHGSCDAILP